MSEAPTLSVPPNLAYRLVYYKRDFQALLGMAKRTVDKRIAQGLFPPPDFYDGQRAGWRRETIQTYCASLNNRRPAA